MGRRVLLGTVLGLPATAVVVLAALLALWTGVGRLPFAGGASWFKVTKVGEVHYTEEPTAPFFFLAVGNDGRTGDVTVRGDAIHLIGVNPALRAATILDIPRDTSAAVPGHGTEKINAALALGGLRLQAETVGNLVGVPIPFAVTTDFDGFKALVDGVGGVSVNVPIEMNDANSGAVFSPGVHHMNGEQALQFCRNRYDMADGDIGRTLNQGAFIVAALTQLRANHTGAAGTLKALAVLGAHTQLDGIGLADLYRFGRLALSIDPANVRNLVIPIGAGSGTNLGLGAGAAELFADFADDAVLQHH
jgi:LCP family protein required for cell wall assembly